MTRRVLQHVGPIRIGGWLTASGVVALFAWAALSIFSAVVFSAQPSESNEDSEAPGGGLRKLTEKEIERIRFLELRGIRLGRDSAVDSVTVKIDKKVVDEFLVLMEGNPDYSGDRNRGEFRKLTPAQKVHIIAAERGAEFADRIRVTSDPEIFVQFRRNVMPQVLQGCATTGCHGPGGSSVAKFELFKDPKKSAPTTYANFIVLNELSVNDLPLINRSQPSNSLLLTYMLPAKEVKRELRHPGEMEIKPVFQSRGAQGYKRIEAWIASLKHPAEDYGVRLLGRGVTSRPADEPSEPASP